LEPVKKLQNLALLTTPEDKSNKQQNQAGHSFHWLATRAPTLGSDAPGRVEKCRPGALPSPPLPLVSALLATKTFPQI